MDRQIYNQYLDRFHARDYDAVLSYFAPQFEVSFGGYSLRSRDTVRAFYAFLHRHVRETLLVDAFLSDERMIAIKARVKLEGLRELGTDAARAEGCEKLTVPAVGQTLEIRQFIHYHLNLGRFAKVQCAIYESTAGP